MDGFYGSGMIFWIMPLFIYKNVINNSFPEYINKKGVFYA
jgi:hypothetical protein